MRIENLTLKNFRSHHDTKIAFDRFTFITGPNAVGKTSIAAAIAFLLTGKCQFTDERGAQAEDLIRIGAREFYVSGQIGKTLIERTKGAKSHVLDVGGKSGPLMAMQEKIYEGLGVTPDVLSAVLNSSRFLSMDEKGQKQLLAQVLASEKIIATQSIVQDAKAIDHVAFAVWTGELGSISEIDSGYKRFYDARTETNRDIKALGVVEAPEIPDDAPDYKATWKRLDDLRSELTRLTSERARSDERYQSVLRSVGEKRESLTKRKTEAEKRKLTTDEAETFQKVADRKEKAEALRAREKEVRTQITAMLNAENTARMIKIATAEGNVASAKAKVAETKAVIKTIEAIGADCPTCHRELAAKDKAKIVSALKSELAMLENVLKAATGELDEFRGILVPPSTPEMGKLQADLSKITAQILSVGDYAAAEERVKADRLAVIEASKIDRELREVTDPAIPDTSELAGKIDELNTRIGKGEEVLAQVGELQRLRDSYDQWKGKKAALEAKLEVLARLIEFFGPNGIKATLIGDKIAPFTIAVNRSLNQFGYVANFTLEPYSFNVAESDGGQWRSLRQLSESEQFRFGVAFQIALAMATGLKFVVIDRADVLDNESRGALTAMLLGSELDQCIVLSTTDKEAPTDLPPGVKFIDLGHRKAVAA
jgi:DNA repair exonuclease SbcCD ATPase subunit